LRPTTLLEKVEEETFGDALYLGTKGRYSSFHLWITCKRVDARKLCDPRWDMP